MSKVSLEERTIFKGIHEKTRVVAVASGKGGVGKSTLALHLAFSLKENGVKVGLVDADIYGPSLPYLLGCQAVHKVSRGGIDPIDVYGLEVVSRGFLVQGQEASLWRGPLAQRFLLSLVEGAYWGPLDVLLIDLPPGTCDISLTVCQKIPLSGALMVSTAQELALLDVRKSIVMFETLSVPILGLIENMSYFTCEACQEMSPFFDRGLVKKEALNLGYDFLGEIPWLKSLTESLILLEGKIYKHEYQEIHKIFHPICTRIQEKIS